MTTYNVCERLIAAKLPLKTTAPEEWEAFKTDMSGKLDVFLLANRMDSEQYNALIEMMK